MVAPWSILLASMWTSLCLHFSQCSRLHEVITQTQTPSVTAAAQEVMIRIRMPSSFISIKRLYSNKAVNSHTVTCLLVIQIWIFNLLTLPDTATLTVLPAASPSFSPFWSFYSSFALSTVRRKKHINKILSIKYNVNISLLEEKINA